MGMFSTKIETYVGTSVSRMIKDEMVPDSIKAAMAAAIYKGDDLVDNILEAAANTLEYRANRMYRYAQNNSPFGLPTGEIYSNTFGGAEIQAILDQIEGTPVLIEYRNFGNANLIHMAWMTLISSHGYNPQTNILGNLTTSTGTNVYLEDMVIEMPDSLINSHDPNEIAVWGVPPNAGYTPERPVVTNVEEYGFTIPEEPMFSSSVSVPRVKVHYLWEDKEKDNRGRLQRSIESGTFYIYPFELDRESDFFHVKYQVGTQTKYWMYKYGSGGYPALDSVSAVNLTETGDYYPNIYFRLNKAQLAADTSSQQYKSQAKMAKCLGLDFKTLSDAIAENPDIGDIESGFIALGVNADSTDPIDLAYLYSFFDNLYYYQQGQGGLKSISQLKVDTLNVGNSIRIADGALETQFTNNGIFRKRIKGSIGSVGVVTTQKLTIELTSTYTTTGRGGTTQTRITRVPSRIYRKQISVNFYDEIQVVNPLMKYTVNGDRRTAIGDNDGEVLLIPLDRSLLSGFNSRDSERLHGRALHVVCNSLVQVKVRWYQQGWFSDLLLIVAVVLTIASMGADGGTFMQIAAAVAAGSYVTVAVLIAIEILTYFVVQLAVKIFIKIAGVELAFLAALVAAAYAPYAGKSGVSTVLGQLTAQELLFAATALAKGISGEVGEMLSDLRNEAQDFDSYKQSKFKLLGEAEKLLESNSILDPVIVMGESPSTFYRRTVHTGNIGSYVFTDLHNYVGRSLQLPNFSTSMGAFI